MLFPKPQSVARDSPWRYCQMKKADGSRCGRVFRKSMRSARYCGICLKEREEAKKAVRVDRRKRNSIYPKPPKEFWGKKNRERQVEEVQARCEVCKKTEKDCIREFGCSLTRDHWIPVRYITENRLGDPHLDLNIEMICSGCHGVKAQAEHMLFAGNNVGFVMHLRDYGWNMAELGMVMKFYRIYPATIADVLR